MTEGRVDENVEVLIVGGGGAGLTASMLLAGLGVDTLLVSSLPETSRLPKAHVLNQRAMEIMRDCGTDAAIYAIGTPPEQLSHTAFYAGFAGHEGAGRLLFKQESWGAGGTDPDWVAASPMVTTNLPQIRLEPVLKAHAESLSPGRVRFHHEVIDIAQDDSGVTCTVSNHADGGSYSVRSRFVLACDGGRSIGEKVGITLEGHRDLSRTVSLYVTADFSTFAGDPDVLLRWIWSPQSGGMVVMAPMGPTRWGAESEEWVIHLGYTIDDPRAHDDGEVIADMRERLGIGDHPVEVHSVSRWTIGGLVADRFRSGRVFAAGDAAHRHPPTGALGLTSAMHDVHNLCWKLAMVLRGTAGDALLDTYHDERRTVDARNVARSLENSRGYSVIARAMGIGDPSMSPEECWAQLSRLWSADSADAAFRRRVLEIMAAQSQEFREHDVEYGYRYESSAVVTDGTAPTDDDEFRIHVPSTTPGSPLPHAWIEDWEMNRCSTLDLVRPGRFLLIAGEDGDEWCTAARDVAERLGIDLDAVTIGHARGDWRDPRLRWQTVRGIGTDGALLVRPDRCIAWRSKGPTDDPASVLAAVLPRILSRP